MQPSKLAKKIFEFYNIVINRKLETAFKEDSKAAGITQKGHL